MAIDKKLICFARLEEFERQLAAGNILDKSIVFIQDANKIYNRGTYYDCQSPYVLPFDIETLDGLSYSDNEGRLQTDADVFEKAKSAIEMGRMVVIRYGLSDAGYHICDATYNGDAISVRVYNGLMLYSFEIYASSQGSIIVEQYSLQSELVDGVNIATINGQSLTAGGDLTIESGSKVYNWELQADETGNIKGTLTKEEFENIRDCDILTIQGMPCIKVPFGSDIIINMSTSSAGEDFSVGVIVIIINGITYEYSGSLQEATIPTKTSQLENDSNFITSDGLKTINGESIVGSGDITIQGGGVSSYTTNFTYRELYNVAFSEGQSIECNVQLIEDALRNNIPVFVPIDTDPSYYGYAVLEGYAEDLLYFSVKTTNEIIGVEISRTASEIRSEDINTKGIIATVEESVSKERIGELDVANVHALFGGGSVYALPDQANGDEDDILLSKNTVKTINGESIFGSGNIEIGDVIQDYVDSAIANAITTTLNTAV